MQDSKKTDAEVTLWQSTTEYTVHCEETCYPAPSSSYTNIFTGVLFTCAFFFCFFLLSFSSSRRLNDLSPTTSLAPIRRKTNFSGTQHEHVSRAEWTRQISSYVRGSPSSHRSRTCRAISRYLKLSLSPHSSTPSPRLHTLLALVHRSLCYCPCYYPLSSSRKVERRISTSSPRQR